MFHMFDTDIAKRYGVNAAVLFQNIAYWCDHSRANGTNYHDGLYWTYNSVKAFQELFPYLGRSQIGSALQKLLDEGLIVKGNYNKVAYDRTAWYAVTEIGLSIYRKSDIPFTENLQMDLSKNGNGNTENVKPIPNINTNINPISNRRKPFTPPTLEEVQEYAKEKGYDSQEFSPSGFVNFYQSKGWKVGRDKMTDWRAAARGWVSRYRKEHPQSQPKVMSLRERMESASSAERQRMMYGEGEFDPVVTDKPFGG